MIYQFIYVLALSKHNRIYSEPYILFPEKWHFKNYVNGWKGFGGTTFSAFFKNSIFITIIAVFWSGGIICSCAYGFAGVVLEDYLVFNYDYYNADATTGFDNTWYIMFYSFGWVNTGCRL